MLIDWFTVGAQAFNFLVLVWLMKRFLYKPVLRAIDEREKGIAEQVADAAAKRAEADREREDFRRRNETFDLERAALFGQVAAEAKTEREGLMEEARKAADVLTARRQEALRVDADSLSLAVSRRAQQEVFAIARKALADLASTAVEERMVEVFTLRLRSLDGDARGSFARALGTASEPALVRSAFDLPAAQRDAIQTALNETFSAAVPLRFECAPELVGGIELTTNGQKVAWSIVDYLRSLERGVGELLSGKPAATASGEPAPALASE
jgi:F-type H+-transporting ATPase subunit b